MSEVLYQTFTDCVFDQYKHFDDNKSDVTAILPYFYTQLKTFYV